MSGSNGQNDDIVTGLVRGAQLMKGLKSGDTWYYVMLLSEPDEQLDCKSCELPSSWVGRDSTRAYSLDEQGRLTVTGPVRMFANAGELNGPAVKVGGAWIPIEPLPG